MERLFDKFPFLKLVEIKSKTADAGNLKQRQKMLDTVSRFAIIAVLLQPDSCNPTNLHDMEDHVSKAIVQWRKRG